MSSPGYEALARAAREEAIRQGLTAEQAEAELPGWIRQIENPGARVPEYARVMPDPTPYDFGITSDPEATWEDLGPDAQAEAEAEGAEGEAPADPAAAATPCELGASDWPEATWEDVKEAERARIDAIRTAAAEMEAEFPEVTMWM